MQLHFKKPSFRTSIMTFPSLLICASGAVILLLGSLHLLYTFYGPKLLPRDNSLLQHMRTTPPVISSQTSMWKAWVGFNASHSFGAILFGLIYIYLSLFHSAFLFQSYFLLLIGLSLLIGYILLAKIFWFKIPFTGILISLILYSVALVLLWT